MSLQYCLPKGRYGLSSSGSKKNFFMPMCGCMHHVWCRSQKVLPPVLGWPPDDLFDSLNPRGRSVNTSAQTRPAHQIALPKSTERVLLLGAQTAPKNCPQADMLGFPRHQRHFWSGKEPARWAQQIALTRVCARPKKGAALE